MTHTLARPVGVHARTAGFFPPVRPGVGRRRFAPQQWRTLCYERKKERKKEGKTERKSVAKQTQGKERILILMTTAQRNCHEQQKHAYEET